mmetsp:Transcript_4889/g.5298  ORF Transcript_4889/g.5298 Transcript_4889/m.5298 type:complete len:231 (+) Transcript_4889:40-732(+)
MTAEPLRNPFLDTTPYAANNGRQQRLLEDRDETIKAQATRIQYLEGLLEKHGIEFDHPPLIQVDLKKSKSDTSIRQPKPQSSGRKGDKKKRRRSAKSARTKVTSPNKPKSPRQADIDWRCYYCDTEMEPNTGKKVGRIVCHKECWKCRKCSLSFDFSLYYLDAPSKSLYCGDCFNKVSKTAHVDASKDLPVPDMPFTRKSLDTKRYELKKKRKSEKKMRKKMMARKSMDV